MQENFRNCSKINIYSAGASDGSEAYTMAIALLEYAPELAKKSFPRKSLTEAVYNVKLYLNEFSNT